ncbi:hypothetical protein D8M19_06540 [Corynebacterium pseudodiphtheriticum]|nr:hypothetical protein D8M19_06540 [Corynebacterium pseudodiphtheriticum]
MNKAVRRKGVTIAAAALSVALVAPFAQSVAYPEITAAAKAQDATVPNDSQASERPNDVANTRDRIIEADAVKNGYIKTGTDASNARATLSGRAFMANQHTTDPSETSSTPVPEGTKVYLQFYDADGSVSPTYVTRTYNNVKAKEEEQAESGNNVSEDEQSRRGQAGPGFYAFDFRGAYGENNEKRAGMWVDANGGEHQFRARTGQYYRLWIEDFETKDGNTATMLRQVNGFHPGSFVRTAASNIGGFALLATNMQRTALFMTTKPKGEYMTRPRSEWKHDNEGPLSNPGTTIRHNDYLAGRVWFENGSATIAGGPGYGSEDTPAAGYRVVASSLTDEGVSAYKAEIESISDHGKRAAAVKKLLTENPHYISQTVTAPVSEDGYYTVRFDKGKFNRRYVYAYVEDPDGKRQVGYSAYNSPEFRAPNGVSNSLLSQATPQPRPVRNAFNNVHFGLITTPLSELDITNFDMVANPASRGDVAKVKLSGNNLSPLNNKIEWTNSKGDKVHECSVKTLESECDFTIPADAKEGEVYRATLYSGATPVAADSLIVRVPEESDKQAANNNPVYEDASFEQGTAATVNAPKNEDGSALPDGTTFAPGNKVPDGFTVNADGTITVGNGTTVGEHSVPVVVTYPDKSSETIFAKVSIKEPEEAPASDLGYPLDGVQITEKDADAARTKKTGQPSLPDSITKEDGDKYRFGNDLPDGFDEDPNDPNRIVKDGPVGKPTPNDSSDDVVVTINPDTGEITVEAGDKGDTNGPKDIPVEYVGAGDTVKGKDSVSVDVKPRQDSDSGEQSPANELKYPEDEIAIGAKDSGDQRTKESGEPEISASVTKENDDIFRFHKVLPPGFERVNDEETRVKFDGGTPNDEKDDVQLTIDPKTGKVTVVGGENAKAKADIPVELINKDGEPKDSGAISINVTPEEQTPPPATDGDDTEITGLGYPGNIFVAPDNYERSDSTGIPKLPESLKEEGGSFRFGPNLPDGFVKQEPSWPGVEEIVREGDSPSERIVLRINKSNGKVEVQAGDASDYPLSDLPIEYLGANGEVKKGDKVTVLVRPTLQSHRFDPKGKTIIVAQGGNPDAAEGVANKGELPEGTEFEFDGPVDTSTPGEKSAKVIVAYPDGSTESVDVTVNVAAADEDLLPDADRYNPKWESVNTPEDGSAVTVPNSGDDFPADGETDVDLVLKPSAGNKGSDAWDVAMGEDGSITVTPGADAKGGDSVTVDVELTYPDGSTETESFTVTVPDSREAFTRDNFGQPPLTAGDDDDISAEDIFSQADRFDPKAKDGVTAKEGQTPEAGALIDNKGDLPAGTTFEWDTKPDVSVPGKTSGVVKVNYPDGSSETVEVELEVSEVPTQADEFEPKGKTIIVAQGGNPDAAEGVANKGELPEGTEFEFDGPVDTSTPGEKSAKVIVAYPDGSTESVDVTVNVAAADEDLLPDTDRYEPEWNDTTIDDSSQVTVENKGDELPHGTEVELGWSHGGLNQGKEDWDVDLEENGDITITPGADAQPGDAIVVEVELNYPDGTSETKTFVVQVNGDREEFVPGNFGALPPLTGDDNDDLTAGDVFTEAPTVNPVNPGDKVITGTGKPGATITVTGPNGSSTTTKVNENGNWSIDVPGGATPESQYIVSQKDGDKAESDQVIVTVGKGGGEPVNPGLSSGSSNFDIPRHLQCAVFAGGVTAIPLILLSPLHNMYELVMNPHLAGLREQFNREIHAIDQQVRRSLGVEGHPALQVLDHINGRVHQFNQQLGQFAHENRHIGLAAAAIAVAGLSYQHCMNTQANQSSSATGSSVDLSSSSSEQQTESRGIVGWFQGLFNRK